MRIVNRNLFGIGRIPRSTLAKVYIYGTSKLTTTTRRGPRSLRIEHVLAISVAATENQLVERETKLTIPDGVNDRVYAGACVLKPLNYLYSNVIVTCLDGTVIAYYV